MNHPFHIIKHLPVLVCIVLFFSSCGIHLTKRRYNPGYYVETIGGNNHRTELLKRDQFTKRTIQSEPVSCEMVRPQWDSIVPKRENLAAINKPSGIKKTFGTHCDRIYLLNGKMILGTYIQMTDKLFTYKDCGGNSTNIVSIELKKVKFIVREQGDTIFPIVEAERWKKDHPTESTKKGDVERMKKTKTAAVIVYAILGPALMIAGGVLLWWGFSFGGWFAILFTLIGIFLGGSLLLAGGVMIIVAIITGLRK